MLYKRNKSSIQRINFKNKKYTPVLQKRSHELLLYKKLYILTDDIFCKFVAYIVTFIYDIYFHKTKKVVFLSALFL